jgi:hypothetical protein
VARQLGHDPPPDAQPVRPRHRRAWGAPAGPSEAAIEEARHS